MYISTLIWDVRSILIRNVYLARFFSTLFPLETHLTLFRNVFRRYSGFPFCIAIISEGTSSHLLLDSSRFAFYHRRGDKQSSFTWQQSFCIAIISEGTSSHLLHDSNGFALLSSARGQAGIFYVTAMVLHCYHQRRDKQSSFTWQQWFCIAIISEGTNNHLLRDSNDFALLSSTRGQEVIC